MMIAENTTEIKIDRDYTSRVIKDFISNTTENDTNEVQDLKSRGRKQYFNRQEILKALSQLQQTFKAVYIPGQSVNINTDDFKSALLNSVAKLNKTAIPRNMNQIDGRTIDFVEMLFGAFLRNQNISDAVKTLLLRLQIPVIKTSMLDNNFFYDHKHPARNVLDTIAHIGIGIEDKDNTVYQTMDLIIEQLIRSFDQNTISFCTALNSLNRLIEIENKKLKENEKQTRQKIIQEHARQIVLTELQFHTMKTRIPKPVQPLILNHWSTLMFHRYIRHGKDSIQWKEATNILRLLIETLKPISSANQWRSLNAIHMEVVSSITHVLNGTNQNKEKVFMAINNLKRIYEKTLKESEFYQANHSGKANKAETLKNLSADSTDNNGPTPMEQQIHLAKKKINRLPIEAKPNTWFEIFTEDGRPVRRLKLSVIIQEDARLIFVDRLGVKVLEKDAEEFTRELSNKQSRMIADHSIFDHALSQVISSIAANR
jgi:hypothetical protein